jgi:predicted Holliday junction resolvase-like endonuclease
MEIIVIVIVQLVIVMAFSAFMLYREFKHMNARLEARISKLEEASKKRVPYRTQEELLDAMAALDAFENEVDLGKAMIENAKAHIAKGLQVGTKQEDK